MTWWQRFLEPVRALLRTRPFPVWGTEWQRARLLQPAAAVEIVGGWHDSIELVVLDRAGGEHELGSRHAPEYSRVGPLSGVVVRYRHSANPIPPKLELRLHEHAEVLALRRTPGTFTKLLAIPSTVR